MVIAFITFTVFMLGFIVGVGCVTIINILTDDK